MLQQNSILIFLGILILSIGSFAQGYAVISNKENKILKISEVELRSIYLGEKFYWPSTVKIRPARLGDSDRATLAFVEGTLGMKIDDYIANWRNRLFSGRAIPPRKFESQSELTEFVKNTPGAIGILAADAKGPIAGVELLEVNSK